MSQAFTFGFDNDDIEDSAIEEDAMGIDSRPLGQGDLRLLNARLHQLEDVLSTFPSSLSYNTISIPSPSLVDHKIPRRDLHDIRTQLMAEDTTFDSTAVAGLSADDITPNIYEGGFKSWECSLDLAKYLLQSQNALNENSRDLNIIELGAGTGLPSTTILQHWLRRPQSHHPPSLHICLADYNQSVLELATIPNSFLAWYLTRHPSPEQGDVDITAELLQQFHSDLSSHRISITAISGTWGAEFTSIISSLHPDPTHKSSSNTIILASETIYSPTSIRIFTETLITLLSTSTNGTVEAFVAAKRVYFGVGGSVDEFLHVLAEKGGEARTVFETGEGVGRVILEVVKCNR